MSNGIVRSRALRWTGAAVVLGGIALAVGMGARGRSADPMAGIPVAPAARGPLTISVSVSGTIKSRQQEVLKCEVEGGSTILYLIPEGTRVKQGTLLVELDGSKLQDQRVAQEIAVKNAEAAYISAEEAYEVAKSQALSDTAKARLDARFAEEDLNKYIKGDYVTESKDKESKVKLAEESLEQAKYKRDWSERLFEAKYIAESQYEADKLAFTRANTELELAQNQLSLLKDYTYKRKIAELESAIEQTKMALERVERKAKADIIQAEAARDARKLEFDRQKGMLEKLKRMIEKTKIYATTDGLVVYATTGDGGWRYNREPLIEGSIVRERQDLICLPTTSSVMAEVKIHESNLDKISLGLPVIVTIDALPGKTFTGRVAKIAPLPDAGSMWQNPDMKVYNTEIHLDEGDDDLRTGMSCRAEIIVDRYADAIHVPVQSVVRIGRQPTVYVATPKGLEPRPVKLGLDNNSRIRVLEGLAAGEAVALNPPLTQTQAGEESDARGQAVAEMKFPAPTTRPQGRTGEPAAGAANGEPRAGAGPGRVDGAGGGRTLTAEQREEMRKRLESMTPEQREQMRSQRQGRGGSRGPNAAPAGGPQ